jgi:hypothetical protein
MFEVITALLVPVLILGAIVFVIGRRVMQFKELSEHGIDTDAIILEKRSVRPGSSGGWKKKIVYRYQDSSGGSHEATTIVSDQIYDRYAEGEAFPVTYSARKPSVSGPRYLVDEARKLKAKKTS